MSTGQLLSLGTSNGGIWHLNGNSNDSGPNGNNGTDTAITYIPGKFGQYASFNGTTSLISITDAASLHPAGSYTVGAWINTSVADSASHRIFASYNLPLSSHNFGVIFSMTGTYKAQIFNGWDIANNALTGNTVLNDGHWHFIVGTWDATNLNIYVDGTLDGVPLASTQPTFNATSYARIGVLHDAVNGDTGFWSGQIDEVFFISGLAWNYQQVKNFYSWSLGRMTAII